MANSAIWGIIYHKWLALRAIIINAWGKAKFYYKPNSTWKCVINHTIRAVTSGIITQLTLLAMLLITNSITITALITAIIEGIEVYGPHTLGLVKQIKSHS